MFFPWLYYFVRAEEERRLSSRNIRFLFFLQYFPLAFKNPIFDRSLSLCNIVFYFYLFYHPLNLSWKFQLNTLSYSQDIAETLLINWMHIPPFKLFSNILLNIPKSFIVISIVVIWILHEPAFSFSKQVLKQLAISIIFGSCHRALKGNVIPRSLFVGHFDYYG